MNAAALYLELRALGLVVSVEKGVVVVRGLHALPEAEAERLRGLIRCHKPGLVALLRNAPADLDAQAVLSEARCDAARAGP